MRLSSNAPFPFFNPSVVISEIFCKAEYVALPATVHRHVKAETLTAESVVEETRAFYPPVEIFERVQPPGQTGIGARSVSVGCTGQKRGCGVCQGQDLDRVLVSELSRFYVRSADSDHPDLMLLKPAATRFVGRRYCPLGIHLRSKRDKVSTGA